ncbi:hypothetical protein [Ornithinibacillus californiensis]|nr:hypothetical protein [Ornithinibacillus californiensis]
MKKFKTFAFSMFLGFVVLFTIIQPASMFLADPEYGDLDDIN